MNTEFKLPPLRNRRRLMLKQLFSSWPWIIWLSAALAALLLLPGGLHRIRFHGTAERTYEYVASIQDGRLTSLLVNMGDPVYAGQLLGKLDNSSLAAEVLMDQASLMKTRDKVHSIRCEIEELKLEQTQKNADLQILESKQERTEKLVSKNLLLEQEIEDLQPQIEATKSIIKQYSSLIAMYETRLKAAEMNVEAFDSNELQQHQTEQCQLKATTSGVVAEVLHQVGDVVETGQTILRISNISTSRIIAFVPEERLSNIDEGEKCQVISSVSRKTYMGTVKTVTADIRKLPVYTGFSDAIRRGRRLVIELDNGEQMTPGERVVVVPDVSIFDQWLGKK